MPQLQRQPAATQPFAVVRTPGRVGMLAAEIGAACDAHEAVAPRLRRALERAASDPALLSAEQREACTNGYARHVIYSDPLGRFTILAIVWNAGQFSPPHAHHTWCGYAVYENPLHETLFRFDPASGKAEPGRTEVRVPGYSCYAGAGLDQIHRLGNSGPRPAISIHAYGVERERIATHVNRVVDVAP